MCHAYLTARSSRTRWKVAKWHWNRSRNRIKFAAGQEYCYRSLGRGSHRCVCVYVCLFVCVWVYFYSWACAISWRIGVQHGVTRPIRVRAHLIKTDDCKCVFIVGCTQALPNGYVLITAKPRISPAPTYFATSASRLRQGCELEIVAMACMTPVRNRNSCRM